MSGSGNIRTGNISGTGIAIGPGAHAEVRIGGTEQGEIAAMIAQLRQDIAASGLNQGSKQALSGGPVTELAQAAQTGSQSGIAAALSKTDEALKYAGATAEHASSIIATLSRIAGLAGLAFKTVAPFLAGLI